jgi:hypothetical protein
MTVIVTAGATMACSMGSTPSTLNVLGRHACATTPIATVNDFAAVNVPPFGLCRSPLNPLVASATATAGGTLTPQPCKPLTTSMWAPGSVTTSVGGAPCLVQTSTLACQYGGVISVLSPGQALTTAV